MVKTRDLLQLVTYTSVLIGYAAVFRYVSILSSAAFAGLVLFAAYLHRSQQLVISRWVLNTLSILILVLSAARVSPEFLVEPILDGLLVLTAIKLVEADKVRDYMQIYALCLFLLLGSALISISLVFMIYLFPLSMLLTVSLILLAYDSVDGNALLSRTAVHRVFLQALLICFLSIPTTVILFIILPRTNYPILMFLNKPSTARSGFTNRVSLGDVAQIQEDDTVIFRAAMPRIPQTDLYWRGIVLDTFDGRNWNVSKPSGSINSLPLHGTLIHQIIYLEPYGNKYLFGLDKPVNIHLASAQGHADFTYSISKGIYRRLRYEVDSVVTNQIPTQQVNYSRYLQIPKDFSKPIRRLAARLAQGQTPPETVQTFLNFLGSSKFHYSLEDLPVTKAPLEAFLFQYHRGNCEYFAAALAVLLRLRGIPSRLVGGYKGGYYNPAGKYYLVLQKHAHVWTEAYVNNRGWIRLDPTPPMVLRPSEIYRKRFLAKLRLLFDVLNYYWYKLVINYDFNKQLYLLNKVRRLTSLSRWKPHWNRISIIRPVKFGLICVFFGLLVLWGIRSRRGDETLRLVHQFRTKMRRYGYEMGACEGLEEFVNRITDPDLRQKSFRFVVDLEEIIYRDTPLTAEKKRYLRKYLRQL